MIWLMDPYYNGLKLDTGNAKFQFWSGMLKPCGTELLSTPIDIYV